MPHPADHVEAIIDVALMRNLAAFTIHAVQRHRRAAAITFGSIVAGAAAAWLLLPRTYYAETKLLAERNVEMPLLGNPQRKMPTESDTPTRLASEAIMSRSNLEAIVTSTGLVAAWDARESPLSRLEERVKAWIAGPRSPQDKINALVWSLSTRMAVKVGDGTITIGITWPDAQMAARILQAAQENFLEQRHSEQLALITESISILQQNATDVHDQIKNTLDSLAHVREAVAPRDPPPLVAALQRPRPVPNGEIAALQAKLEGVQRTIADLEQYRNRRLAELQATLADQQNTYGPAHPVIENTRQLIRSLATDSPQLAQAKRDEADLRAQLTAKGADSIKAAAVSGTDPLLAAAALRSLDRLRADSIINEKQVYDRARLRIAIQSYQDLLQRIDGARIELQTARAAFKYQYAVLAPAEVPSSPIKPKLKLLAGGGVVLGFLLAVFVSVALDVVSGRVIEAWQIERAIGLPVLGSIPHA